MAEASDFATGKNNELPTLPAKAWFVPNSIMKISVHWSLSVILRLQ